MLRKRTAPFAGNPARCADRRALNPWSAIAPCALGVAIAVAAGGEAPNVADLIQRSNQAVQMDWQSYPEYSYFERDVEAHGTKTYHVMMIDGTPYKELAAVNERKLSPDNQKKAQQSLGKTRAARDHEPAEERDKRLAAYNRDRQRDHELVDQLTRAFDFKYLRDETLGKYQTYVLQATPKPGYQPPDTRAQVLTGMRGTMWIDQKTYQWVKVQAEVIHPVSIDGFLARVEPGTKFELERQPVAPGLWFPSHFAVRAHARILDVFGHSVHSDETYYDYQKAAGPAAPANKGF